MTTTCLSSSPSLLIAVLHGATLGGVAAAVVLTRARLRGWQIAEPWAGTAAWTLLGSVVLALVPAAHAVP